MRPVSSGPRNKAARAFCLVGTAVTVLCAIAVSAQERGRESERSQAAGPYPRLPGAVTTAPEGIGKDAPFDVAKFFTTVPRGRNAAPLYLDALFEFGAEMGACFPEGPEQARGAPRPLIDQSATPSWSNGSYKTGKPCPPRASTR